MMMSFLGRSLVALVALGAGCGAFAPSGGSGAAPPSSRQTPSEPSSDVALNLLGVPYGEESRKYRRTVYTWDDWVKHREQDRFFRNLGTTFSSGLVRSILKEVATVATIATTIVLWNCLLVDGWTDFSGVHHDAITTGFGDPSVMPRLSLPLVPFSLSVSSLGLLLVFRSNNAYRRWDEARKAWGLNINHTRNIVRMGTAWSDPAIEPSLEKREAALQKLARSTWAVVRSMMRHISNPEDEVDYAAELRARLPPAQAEGLLAAIHRPNKAMSDLSEAVNELPMHFLRKNEMDKDISLFEDNLGGCERLLSSPVPLFYTRHTARFLSSWLLLMPLCLYEPFKMTWNHIGMIPSAAVVALFMFGIEEIAVELEEPFSVLPLQGMCDKIGMNVDEIAGWHAEVVGKGNQYR